MNKKFSISFIIASHNGENKLPNLISSMPFEEIVKKDFNVIFVDNNSTDSTFDIMTDVSRKYPGVTNLIQESNKGLAHAQNAALKIAKNEVLIFIDDDCILSDDYLDIFLQKFDEQKFQFGSGEILIRDQGADRRIANTSWWTDLNDCILPPYSFITPGQIQGSNMFFLKKVLDDIGGIQGIGPRLNNDIMTAYCASASGYTGIMMRGPIVFHDHRKAAGSDDATKTSNYYDYIRGIYYAKVALKNDPRALLYWSTRAQEIISQDDIGIITRELLGMVDTFSKLD